MERVDMVITYVNNKDEKWKKSFIDYCITHNKRERIISLYNERYNGVNWLSYQLKLIEKNMPFINKIYLVVSNMEQVKDIKLNNKVVVITHDTIIPYRYLPTFNSTTIEMFLHKIPNLSEHYIYTNDDMLPIKPLQASDFFVDGKIKIKFIKEEFDSCLSQFKWQCNNNQIDICKKLKVPYNNYFLRPIHSFVPMIKSHCEECYNTLQDRINKYLSAFRTEYNHNQYIFALYELLKYGTLDSDIQFLYSEFKEQVNMNNQIVCVNIERNKENVNLFIKELDKLCE